jgi:hypothetical protein
MTRYERLRIILVVVNLFVTLGLPFVILYVNAKLNSQQPCTHFENDKK